MIKLKKTARKLERISQLAGELKTLTPVRGLPTDPDSADYPTDYSADYSTDYSTDYPYGLP